MDKDERRKIIEWSINCSLRSIKQEEREVLKEFLTEYLRVRLYFVGDDVLAEFRSQGWLYSNRDWRNRWGGLMKHLTAKNYVEVIGKETPSHGHSHIEKICKYRSLYYDTNKPVEQPKQGSLL